MAAPVTTPAPTAMKADVLALSSIMMAPLHPLPKFMKLLLPQLLPLMVPEELVHIPYPEPLTHVPRTGTAQAAELPNRKAAVAPIPVAILNILEGSCARRENTASSPVSRPRTAPELLLPRTAAVSATATKVPTFSFQILRYDLFINRIDPQKRPSFTKNLRRKTF